MTDDSMNKDQFFLKNICDESQSVVLLEGESDALLEGLRASIEAKHLPLVTYDYASEEMFAPYAPWLGRVLEVLSVQERSARQRLYREEKIYYLLEQLLESHLGQGEPSRYEPLIEEEVQYEIGEIIEGLYRLFLRLVVGQNPLVMILKNLQMAPVSSLAFLKRLAEKPCGTFQVYGMFSGEEGVSPEAWRELIDACQARNQVFRMERGEVSLPRVPSWKRVRVQSPEALKNLQRLFLQYNAVQDAYLLGSSLKEDASSLSWNEADQWMISWQTARAAFLLREYNEAARYLNEAFVLMDRLAVAEASRMLLYRDMAFVFFMKDVIGEALKILDKAFHIPGAESYKEAYFAVFFLYFQIEDKNRKQQPRPWKTLYDKIIALATELRYENHLALIYINPYGIYSEYTSDQDRYNTLLLNEQGIALAKKLRNTYRLSHGYQIRGLIYAVMGQYDQVIVWYRRSLVLKKRMGFPLEIAYGYNGVGFYYYMMGRYEDAHRYYREALEYLLALKDFHEVAMTYFNMGMNYLLALNAPYASLFFEEVVGLLDTLGMNGLAYHSLFGIYAVLGTAYALEGKWTMAYDCVNQIRVQGLLPYLEKNEEYFFIAILLGLLAFHEGKEEDVVRRFREANYYLHRTNDSIAYMIPWYYLVTSVVYAHLGMGDLADQMWKEGIRQSEIKDFPSYRLVFSHGKREFHQPMFAATELPAFRFIRELAEVEHKVSRMYRQMQDVYVLNSLQQGFLESTSAEALINETLEKIVQYFLIDFACVLERREGKWQRIAHGGEDIPCEDEEALWEQWGESSQEIFFRIDRKDERIGKVQEAVSSFVVLPLRWGHHEGALVCGTLKGRTMLSTEDVRVLKLIAGQMALGLQRLVYVAEVERRKQELEQAYARLEEMATHDILTGALNPLSFDRRMSEEMERILRYGKGKGVFSLLFLDVDNFKVINDSYGHAMGDRVLSLAGSLLRRELRKVDVLFRYGGDEFIILLPETSGEDALRLGERIVQHIPGRIASELGLAEKPTFSVGIVEYKGEVDVSQQMLVQRADQALYEAKNRGKNQCVFKR